MAQVLVFDAIGMRELNDGAHPENEQDIPFRMVECNDLDDYYRELRCNLFDIVCYKVGDKVFDIFVDDEGLFADDPIVSARNAGLEPLLVGNLIFANHDSKGNTTSITTEDMFTILGQFRMGVNQNLEPRYWIECEV